MTHGDPKDPKVNPKVTHGDPKDPQSDPQGHPKNATNKNNETAAEWRRYHARTPQHSDVLEAQQKYSKTYVFYCRKWTVL